MFFFYFVIFFYICRILWVISKIYIEIMKFIFFFLKNINKYRGKIFLWLFIYIVGILYYYGRNISIKIKVLKY